MPGLLKALFDTFHCFYYPILFCASILSYLSFKKGNRKYGFLLTLFIATILFELLSSYMDFKQDLDHYYTLPVFNALEYSMLVFYFVKTCDNIVIQKLGKLSIVLFALNSLVFSALIMRSLQKYVRLLTLNLQIEVMLLLVIYTYLLFNIEDDLATPLHKRQDFWISAGIIVFYGGIFWLLGLYPVLINIDQNTARTAYASIVQPLNVILYVSISIGIICTLWEKKYTTQLN